MKQQQFPRSLMRELKYKLRERKCIAVEKSGENFIFFMENSILIAEFFPSKWEEFWVFKEFAIQRSFLKESVQEDLAETLENVCAN